MKKMYLVLAVTSTLAFLMLATSAFAINNADLLDNLDSTDFALATHAHSTSDVTDLDIALANPVLPTNSTEPYTCDSTAAGAIVLSK